MTVIIKKRTRASQESQSRTFCLSSIREEPLSAFPTREAPARSLRSISPAGRLQSRPPGDKLVRSSKLMQGAEFSDQREQRQGHRNYHAANDHAHKPKQQRLHNSSQVLHRSHHLFFLEGRHLLE